MSCRVSPVHARVADPKPPQVGICSGTLPCPFRPGCGRSGKAHTPLSRPPSRRTATAGQGVARRFRMSFVIAHSRRPTRTVRGGPNASNRGTVSRITHLVSGGLHLGDFPGQPTIDHAEITGVTFVFKPEVFTAGCIEWVRCVR